jgi:hypothetical protein
MELNRELVHESFPECITTYTETYNDFLNCTVEQCIEATNVILDEIQMRATIAGNLFVKEELDKIESALMALRDLIEQKDPSLIHTSH